jgi:ABC-type uncharacterized transport system substrate-binding protein
MPKPPRVRSFISSGLILGAASALAASVSATGAIAHPHVWIDVGIDAVFEPDGRLSSIQERWALDWNFTNAEVLPYVDGDGNRILAEAEVERAIRYYFNFATVYRYFTHLEVDGVTVHTEIPEAPTVTFSDGFFFVEAELKLAEPVRIQRTASLDVYDGEIYYSFDFPHEGAPHPSGQPWPADAPLGEGAIAATNLPAGCGIGRRPPEMLDPMANLLLQRLGLRTAGDPAAGHPVRLVVTCN